MKKKLSLAFGLFVLVCGIYAVFFAPQAPVANPVHPPAPPTHRMPPPESTRAVTPLPFSPTPASAGTETEPGNKSTQPTAGMNDASRIAFLHLRLTQAGLTLLKWEPQPGRLKSRAAPRRNPISCEVFSSNNTLLWKDAVEDPSRRYLEWEDPEKPGVIAFKEEFLPAVEFTVRVPFIEKGQRVEFYRINSSPGAQAARQFLGSFTLDTP